MNAVSKPFPELRVVAWVSAAFWAIGTNWLGEWYYPVRGIGYGDLLFVVWFVYALINPQRREALMRALWEVRKFVFLMLIFMAWLLLSATINAYNSGSGPTDVLAIVRLLYYCAIVLFAYIVVMQYGFGSLVCGFIVGVFILTLGRFYDAYTAGASSVVLNGLIIIKDPNVIGNMMGVGVLFCAFGILQGYLKLSLTAALAITAASITTFSKGTWLMELAALFACAVAWFTSFRKTGRSFARFVPVTVVLLAAMSAAIYAYSDLLIDLINLKLETTTRGETAAYRFQFALAALYSMADNPFFGLGFRNYPQVERLYPDVVPEPTENAHNAFLHFGAVGGIPALLLLLLLFAYPFAPLYRAMTAESSKMPAALFTGLVLVVMALSGSVQLQLVAQPFYWLFCGIVFGWHARVVNRPL
jgi:O-antigen ligase